MGEVHPRWRLAFVARHRAAQALLPPFLDRVPQGLSPAGALVLSIELKAL